MGLFSKFFNKKVYNNYPRKGFDFSYTMKEYSSIKCNRYNSATVQRHLEILKDCSKLINTTKNPDVFFSRYLIALALLNDLLLIEHKNIFKGDTPSEIKKQFYEKEILTVNDFLDRYYNDTLLKVNSLKTEKAKSSKIDKFCNGLNNYKQYLSVESINKYDNLCLKLKQKNKKDENI